MVPPFGVTRGAFVDNAAAIKSVVNIPVSAVGRINDPDLAEAIRETCDELGVRTTVEVAGDFDDAVSAARKIAGPEGLICAFGSLYSVADVKAAFLRAADSNSLQS